MYDHVRYLVEECDSMQGFQFFVDDDDVCIKPTPPPPHPHPHPHAHPHPHPYPYLSPLQGFGGVSSALLDLIGDEFGNTSIMLYSVSHPHVGEKSQEMAHNLNRCLAFASFNEIADVIVPLFTNSPFEIPHYQVGDV